MATDEDDAASRLERERARSEGIAARDDRAPVRPSERAPDRPTDRPTERPVDRQPDRPSDRPSDRASDRASDRPERPTDRAPERPSERAYERPSERVYERPNERPNERRDDRRDDLPETLRQRLESLVPELVKKTFAAGMGAVFSTEEGIRRIARESLPEVAGYIASSADGAKDKVFEVIARETREFLSTLNVSEEIAKILTTLSFEIKTEIRFIPNSERFTGAEPDVKASVRLKRTDGARDKDKDEGEPARDSRSRLRFWRRDEGGEPGEGEGSDK